MTETTRTAAELLADLHARAVARKRAAYVAGLRTIADALEADPALPLPYGSERPSYLRISIYARNRDEVQAWVDLADEVGTQSMDRGNYTLELTVGGVHLHLYAGVETIGGKVEQLVRPEPFAQREVAR